MLTVFSYNSHKLFKLRKPSLKRFNPVQEWWFVGWSRGNPLLGYWARMLQNPTLAEEAIEPSLAALGKRYRAQHAFLALKHFADFAILDEKILVEIDGHSHDTPGQKEKDLRHMIATTGLGWVTARIKNEQALSEPGPALQEALDDAAAKRALGTDALVSLYQARLDRLHRDYPHLLAAVAKTPKRRRRPKSVSRPPKSAKPRAGRSRATSAPA